MADYWKSNERYYCKYCKCYILDNEANKRQHLTGKKHKEKVEEYLSSVRKRNYEQRQEKEQLAAEVKKIEALAEKAYVKQDGGRIKRNREVEKHDGRLVGAEAEIEKDKRKEKEKKEKQDENGKEEPAEEKKVLSKTTSIGQWATVDEGESAFCDTADADEPHHDAAAAAESEHHEEHVASASYTNAEVLKQLHRGSEVEDSESHLFRSRSKNRPKKKTTSGGGSKKRKMNFGSAAVAGGAGLSFDDGDEADAL